MLRLLLLIGSNVTALVIPTLGAGDTLLCRSQVQVTCRRVCRVDKSPVDLRFDFANRTISFCRGERCDNVTLSFKDDTGQWDTRQYRLFSSSKRGERTFFLSGAIDL